MSGDRVDPALAINATIGKAASAAAFGIEAKVKASMRAVIRSNWLTSDDEVLFRSGIGGALLDVGPDSADGRRLVASVDALRKIGMLVEAAGNGIGIDISSLVPEDDAPETLPLLKWWIETKAEKAPGR